MSRKPKRPSSPIGDPLTVEELRERLWKARVLRKPERFPAEAELLLVRQYNADQGQYVIDQLLYPANDAKREVIMSIEAAQGALAKLAEIERQFLASAEAAAAANPEYLVFEVSAGAKREHLAEIAAIDRLLTEVNASPVLAERRNTTGKWQENGLYWIDMLNKARATIGRIPLKFSDDGPAGHFLVELAPLLTGKGPTTPQSAAQQMKLARRQQAQQDVTEDEPFDLDGPVIDPAPVS